MKILSVIANLLGIGGGYLENRAKLKELKQIQEHEITKAETRAIVDRIMSNTESDNAIDLETARNKKYTIKDEIVTYLFLIPVIVASISPFIIAWHHGDWINMNQLVKNSYDSLDQLPAWYKYVVFLVVVDVLGFRSFLRKVVDKFIERKFGKTKSSQPTIKQEPASNSNSRKSDRLNRRIQRLEDKLKKEAENDQ